MSLTFEELKEKLRAEDIDTIISVLNLTTEYLIDEGMLDDLIDKYFDDLEELYTRRLEEDGY